MIESVDIGRYSTFRGSGRPAAYVRHGPLKVALHGPDRRRVVDIEHLSRRVAEVRTMNDALEELAQIRQRYINDRYVFIAGSEVRELIEILGALPSHIDALASTGEGLATDPTLPFRRSRNGRFLIDCERRRLSMLKQQPFILTEDEEFIRHDSGMVREFSELELGLTQNTALHALFFLKAFLIDGVGTVERPGLRYSTRLWISTLFALRTVTTPGMVGEPAQEGVHSDGADHVMSTYLGGENMAKSAAVTSVHSVLERSGIRPEQADPRYIIDRVQHRKLLDTLLIADHERKHSVTPLTSSATAQRSVRDMLIFFTRKPTLEGHVSHRYDSLELNEDTPLLVHFPFGAR